MQTPAKFRETAYGVLPTVEDLNAQDKLQPAAEAVGNTAFYLDHGYVRLRDHMGSDLTVVNAARVSFDAASSWKYHLRNTGQYLSEKDVNLLKFLAEGGHWSPFAHPQISLELKIPGMVLDQLVKHRIGMVYSDDAAFVAYENAADNQLSMRYKEPQEFYVPNKDAWREAPDNKKQGSGPGMVDTDTYGASATYGLEDVIRHAMGNYRSMLENGVAPEQARLVLPYYAMYTKRYWTSSLMGIIRFLQLREEEHAQYEIRELAQKVHQLVYPLYPHSLNAYGLSLPATDS